MLSFCMALCQIAALHAVDNDRNLGRISSGTAIDRRASFVLSNINEGVVVELRNAWKRSGCGTKAAEALVLVVRMTDGSIKAIPAGFTNQAYKFTFKWNPAAIAIFHTHPNKQIPEPQEPDILVADKFGVLMFTITLNGMFMYDPATRRVSRILAGLDWENLSNWTLSAHRHK